MRPFAIINILITLYYRTDMILLSKLPLERMTNETAVGLYSASYKFIDTLQMIPAIVTGAVFPFFSRLYFEDKNKFHSTFQRILKYLVFLGLPMAVGTTLLAKPIIQLAYGQEFLPSASSLQILIWAVSIIFVNSLFASTLTSVGKMNILIVTTGLNVVFSLSSNFILIPSYGASLGFIGASLTTLLTEILGFIIIWRYFSKHVQKLNLAATISKPLLAALVMGGIILFIGRNLFVSLLVSPPIYFGLLYLLKGFDQEDRKVLANIFQLRKS